MLDAALERYPDIIAIVITGYGTVKDAVDAIKQGAADFITKPFQFDELLHVLNSALEQRRLRSENAYLRSQLEAALPHRRARRHEPRRCASCSTCSRPWRRRRARC